jgi:hypothetical protein
MLMPRFLERAHAPDTTGETPEAGSGDIEQKN